MKSKTKHETLSDVKSDIQKNNQPILGSNQFWGSIIIFMLLPQWLFGLKKNLSTIDAPPGVPGVSKDAPGSIKHAS